MVGIGMIFDETYRPFFENTRRDGLYDRRFGLCEVELAAVASRTGHRAEAYKQASMGRIADFQSFAEPECDRPAIGNRRRFCLRGNAG